MLGSVNDNRVFDVHGAGSWSGASRSALEQAFEPVLGPAAHAVRGARQGAALAGGRRRRRSAPRPRRTVGAMIEAGGRRLAYVPGCAARHRRPCASASPASTLSSSTAPCSHDDDMIAAGVGTKTGLAHGPRADAGRRRLDRGARRRAIGRRIFVHINNTNPVLIEGSAERRMPRRRAGRSPMTGWSFSHDRSLATSAGRRPSLLTADELEAALRDIGARRYHNLHPFHRLLHGGKLNKRPGPGLGAQPLLLPGDDPGQGRRRAGPHGGRRACAGSGASASSTMTATREGDGGIERWLQARPRASACRATT